MIHSMLRSPLSLVLLVGLAACQSVSSGPKTAVFSVGNNKINEACRAQPTTRPEQVKDAEAAVNIFCGNWKEPSGQVIRAKLDAGQEDAVPLAATPWWRARLEQQTTCTNPQPTVILNGVPAQLLECRMKKGGWPHVAIAARIDGAAYFANGIPAAVAQLENAIGTMASVVKLEADGERAGSRSAIAERLETSVQFSAGDLSEYENATRLAQYYNSLRDFAKAEEQYRRMLELIQRLRPDDSHALADAYMHLALEMSNQKRFSLASGLFERAAGLLDGADDTLRLRFDSYRALHLANQQKYEPALELARDVTARRAKISLAAGAGKGKAGNTPSIALGGLSKNAEILYADTAQSLYTEAWMLERIRRTGDAIEAVDRANKILDQAQMAPTWWRPQLRALEANLYANTGDTSRAIDLLQTTINEQRRLFNKSRLEVLSLFDLGKLLAKSGRTDEALKTFRAAHAMAAERSMSLPYETVYPFFDVVLKLAESKPDQRDQLYTELFQVGQLVRGTVTTQAIAQTAARSAADSSGAGGIIRRLQDAERELDRAKEDQTRIESDAQALPVELDAARKLANKKAAEVAALTQEVLAAFPNYKAMLGAPISLADVQQALGPKEAVYQVLVGDPMSVAFLIRKDGIQAYQVRMSAGKVATVVKTLRTPFDSADLPEFDVPAAHELYQTLFGPVAEQVAALKHLITIPSGALLSLPFGVLVTEPHGRVADNLDYRGVSWLGRKVALTLSPSARSFVDVRRVSKSTAPRTFIGFGDPVPLKNVDSVMRLRNLPDSCRTEVKQIAALPKLEGSDKEVEMVARSLGASSDVLFLQGNFNMDRIQQLNQAGADGSRTALEQYRIVYFATHGLLPTELNCWSEPALLVSHPGGDDAKTDGLLTASQIEKLHLNADLVILSACNTGGEGSGGGESLTGIARAFFASGARSVLVSHWQVSNTATVKLMTKTFEALAQAGGSSLALRDSQLAMLNDLELSHPFFWGAFTVVGDGAMRL